MRRGLLAGLFVGVLLSAGAVEASAQVCVTVDTARDTFSEADRAAALVLLTRQFEQEGEKVVAAGCPRAFTVAHIRLLDTIVVTMAGPGGQREAVAQGSNDLLAVYSQMIRSLLTGRPMTGLGVTDRTNVTAAQATSRRVHSDSLWYARLGYGAIFAGSTYNTTALGFGYRAELNTYAIDVSFLNAMIGNEGRSSSSSRASAQSILKLSGLRFLSPESNRSAYFGGGLSYGYQNFGGYAFDPVTGGYQSDFSGNGLQGELTVGYELARATAVRVFLQADAIFPFYEAESETFPGPRTPGAQITTTRKYAPALVISVGLGR